MEKQQVWTHVLPLYVGVCILSSLYIRDNNFSKSTHKPTFPTLLGFLLPAETVPACRWPVQEACGVGGGHHGPRRLYYTPTGEVQLQWHFYLPS